MDLEPDDRLSKSETGIRRSPRRRRARPAAARRGPSSRSSARAARSSVASSNGRPTSWSPTGSPLAASRPQGTDRPGSAARLQVMVNTSARYIWSGSSTFSPSLNATVGATGPATTSHDSNAASKSRRMSVRTFCARR